MRLFLSAALLCLVAVPVFAQNNDMRGVMSRLEQMQRQMDTISRQVYSGNPPPEAVSNPALTNNSNTASLAAAMDERLNSIEGSIRQLNNRMDEQDYAVGQMKQQFELYKSDMEMRLKDMERTGSAGASAAAATPATAATPSPASPSTASGDNTSAPATTTPGDVKDLPTDSAAALYDSAFQALREQNYERAQAGFTEFLKRYSNDTLAGNAQYWLGETFYVRGNYAEAAKIFAQGFQKYPKSTKAPDNLLKLGLSLSQSGKKQDACVTLQQLNKQYPNAAAVIKQRATEEMTKLNCGAPVN